jgi:hypothetical protein
MTQEVKGLFVFGAGFGVLRFCNSQAIIGFDSGGAKVFVPKPAGRVLRASAGRGFGSHG